MTFRRSGISGRTMLEDASTTDLQDAHHSPRNRLLAKLPEPVWSLLRQEATYRHLPAGITFARVGEPRSNVYFPETGLVAWVSEMEAGQCVAVAWLGAEGFCNVTVLLGGRHYNYSGVVLVESEGYWLETSSFMNVFKQSEVLQRITLEYAGALMVQLARNAACYRLHSKVPRVARWLLEATDRLGEASLPLTHEVLSNMIGGPRHTTTLALDNLQHRGAIDVERGRIVVIDRDLLLGETCECYSLTKVAS